MRGSTWRSAMHVVTVAAVATLAGCASTPAEDDPVQVKLNDLDARVARIERVVSNQSLVQLAQNLDSMQADVRKLRGRVEELENSNEALKKQQRDLYGDLDKRLGSRAGAAGPGYTGAPGGGGAGSTSAGGGSPGGGVGGSSPGAGYGPVNGTGGSPGGAGACAGANAASGADFAAGSSANAAIGAAGSVGTAGGVGAPVGASSVEQAVYTQAFDALKAGSYSIAITGFKDFLSSYPASGLAENAQYWLGEAYYVTRDYDDAGGAFRNVLQKWPQSRKAPDAMLKLGFTQYEQKRFVDSRKTLEEVTQKFPDTDAARLASDRLKRLPANLPSNPH
jgi:tol-pal system protein YbgF